MGHDYTWAFFWGIAGFMAGVAAAFFLIPLWQAGKDSAIRRNVVILGATIIFTVIAVVLYLTHGQPEMMMTANIPLFPASASPHGHPDMSGNMEMGAGSMEQATAQLAARLRDKGGSDADWKLLEQSYEFLGDNEAAALAAQHRVKDETNTQAETSANTSTDTNLAVKLAPYQQRVQHNVNDAAAWLAIAELNRTARNYVAANDAFARVISLQKMTADSWADYADAAASQLGSLNNQQSRDAIDAALKLKPDHVKALWLQASLMHDTGKYKDAIAGWQKLLTIVPKDSSDHSLIEANLDEARKLADGSAPIAIAQAVAISGDVQLDAAIRSRVAPGMTLFVFAKPADAPGPPAAVFRTTVNTWPAAFVLNDSMSMIPTRKLSQFNTVTVQARLSSSGQAIAQTGDIQSAAVTVDVHAKQRVALKLASVVE